MPVMTIRVKQGERVTVASNGHVFLVEGSSRLMEKDFHFADKSDITVTAPDTQVRREAVDLTAGTVSGDQTARSNAP